MASTIYAGKLTAEWDYGPRRWRVYGPGRMFMVSIPGDRERVHAFMRLMQGLPTGVDPLKGNGKSATIMRSAVRRAHGGRCLRSCCRQVKKVATSQ